MFGRLAVLILLSGGDKWAGARQASALIISKSGRHIESLLLEN